MAKRPKLTPLAQKLRRDVFFGTSPDLPRILEVDVAKLRPNPEQPRTAFPAASLEELAQSIAQHGLLQPIAVARDPEQPDGFIVVAGERRYRAFQRLGKETIPAILTTGDAAEIALIENIQREDLHPLDEARGLAHLIHKHGYTQDEVSKVVGKARRTVGELLGLMALPQRIQEEWRTSAMAKSTLIEIARLDSEAAQLALWERVKHQGITVRAARATKQRAADPGPQEPSAAPVLAAGRGFVQRLRQVVADGGAPEAGLLRDLGTLRDEISALLEQLATKTRPRGGAGRARRSAQ
jgi:ParB family transcriptional regulator, chromosome partitioning protein